MSERTIQQLVARLNYSDPDFDDCTDAAIILLRQHAEIERLKSDAELVNSCAKNLAISMHRKHFSHITQWEPLPDTIGLITQIDNMTCWTRDDVARLTAERETIISDFLKRIGQYVTNDSIREAAIAAAVAAEREACAVVCDGLESLLPGTKTGNMLQWAAYQIRARSAT